MRCFSKASKRWAERNPKINVVRGKIKISFFVGSATPANYSPEGEGLAGEGWSF